MNGSFGERRASRREVLRSSALTVFSAACGCGFGRAIAAASPTSNTGVARDRLRAVLPDPQDDRTPAIDLHFGDGKGFAKWWIPEHVMLGYTDRSTGVSGRVEWKPKDDGSWYYDHTNADGHTRIASAVSPVEFGWKGTLTVENRSDEVWKNTVGVICLLLHASPFLADPLWERTYYRTGGQFVSYAGRERDGGEPVYQMSLVTPRQPIERSQRHIRKWGFTRQPSDDGTIAVVSKDASQVLVTRWQQAHHLQSNRTSSYQCIHANPFLGTLQPGESRTASGCVLLVSGDLESAWKQATAVVPNT